MKLSAVGVLLGALLVAACVRSGAPAPAPLGVFTVDSRLWSAEVGGIRDSSQFAARNANELDDVWQRAVSNRNNPPVLEPVDFQRQMVLMVAAGRMSAGSQIRVDSAGTQRKRTPLGKEEEVLAVHYTITEGCSRVNRDAYPLELVRMRRYDGVIDYVGKRDRAANCR